MKRNTRVILCVVFSIIALLGVGLIFVSRLDPVTQTYDTQQTVCNFAYSIQLNPFQTKSNDCAVLRDDWVQLSIKSNQNVSLLIALTKVGGGQLTVFNNTGDDLNASFPLTNDGAIVATLTNVANNVSEINGSLYVMGATTADASFLNTVYPYRTIGEGLVGLGVIVIIVAIWNPSLEPPMIQPIARREQVAT